VSEVAKVVPSTRARARTREGREGRGCVGFVGLYLGGPRFCPILGETQQTQRSTRAGAGEASRGAAEIATRGEGWLTGDSKSQIGRCRTALSSPPRKRGSRP
jgi:hypothetical protein